MGGTLSLGLLAALAVLGVLVAAPARGGAVQAVSGDRGDAARRAGHSPPPPSPSLGSSNASATDEAGLPLRLEGQVVDSNDQPIGGVRVTIGDGRAVETQADGSFAFDGLTKGRYTVIAEQGDRYAEDQNVRLNETSEPVTLTLIRGPTLIVHVVDQRHQPIAGATVEVDMRKYRTGSDGTARIRAVTRESEYVEVSAAGHARFHDWILTGDDRAATVEPTIVLADGASMCGTVVDDTGSRMAYAHVEVESVDGQRATTFASEAGTWCVPDIPRGKHLVRALAALHIAAVDLAIEHDGSHPTTDIVVRVRPGGEIAGVVVDGNGRPVTNARVRVDSEVDTTDEHGRFIVRGLAPDRYTVTAATPELATASQQVVLDDSGHAELRLVVMPSSLAGIVVDTAGQPVEHDE